MGKSNVEDWWKTSIIRMEPGHIEFRGHPIQDLIGSVSFSQMIWLMLRDNIPDPRHARLLEAALVASVDHGPQAPSIACARMAVTCGVDLNNAMASAVNFLGDVHGGAGEQLVELFYKIDHAGGPDTVPEQLAIFRKAQGKYIPGFGHRFHKTGDPRAPRLMSLVKSLIEEKGIEGRFAAIAQAIETELNKGREHGIPMNIDGATAVIFAELGFAPPLARGIFCLSRSVGILAHAWEQMQQGGRNKGPLPPDYTWTYDSNEPKQD